MLTESLILPVFLASTFVHFISATAIKERTIDDEKIAKLESTADIILGRRRREPAVWGEPAPDYSGVVLDGLTRYVHVLLFVDSKITRHYNYDMPFIKKEVLKMIKEANDYFYQINLRIIVVDVLQTQRSDLSLYSFEEFRNSRLNKLPQHDFAALISYRYAGGLAFVGGMCTSKAVMLCGFYPHNPSAMGSIFFHEVAHLVGVPHRNATDAIDVPNCYCNEIDVEKRSYGPAGCLRIPGYDHDCTLQQMANLLYRNRCLRTRKSSIFDQILVERSLPICGNGVKEHEEECDCGIEPLCSNWNCRPNECKQIIKDWQMYLIAFAIALLSLAAIVLYAYCRFVRASTTHHHSNSFVHMPKGCSQLVHDLRAKYLRYLRQIPCCSNRHHRHHNYTESMRRAGNSLTSTHLIKPKSKLDASSIIVLIDPADSDRLVRRPTLRPKNPPPPPPSTAKEKPISDTQTEQYTEFEATESMQADTKLTKKLPPPLPSKPPKRAALETVEIAEQDIYEIPNSVRMRTSSMLNESADCTNVRPPTQLSTDFDSISRKFDDFDEESEWDYEDEESDQKMIINYTPILSKNERANQSLNEQQPQHNTMNESRALGGLGSGAMRLLGACALEVARIKREESFSSNDSGEQRQCVSDDTGSTGLSEEDEKSISVSNVVKQLNEKLHLSNKN